MRNTLGMPQNLMGLGPSEARDNRIKIHGPEAFEGMRQAGILAAQTLDFITPHVRPGITTGELDRLCHGLSLTTTQSPLLSTIAASRNRSAPRSTMWSVTAYRASGG